MAIEDIKNALSGMGQQLGGMGQQRRNTLGGQADIPTMLRGLGAAIGGQVPQFRQQLQQEQQLQRQQGLDALEFRGALAKSMIQDAVQLNAFSKANNVFEGLSLLEDRAGLEDQLGQDSSPTREMMQRLQSNGFMSIQSDIDETMQMGMDLGILSAPEAYTLAPGAQRRGPDNRLLAQAPQKPDTIIQQSPLDFEEDLRRDVMRTAISGLGEQRQQGQDVISLANDVTQLATLYNEAGQNMAETFLVEKFGAPAISILNLGEEAEAANAIKSYLAPRMRPVGSGSTSDMEVNMYLSSLPIALQSKEGRLLTAQVFQRKANMEIELRNLESQYMNKEITATEYIRQSRDIESQSIFNNQQRQEIQRIVPGFFDSMRLQGVENGSPQEVKVTRLGE